MEVHGAASSGPPIARLIRSGRVHLLPLLLSDQARMLLSRKYDAFTTDRAYGARPRGALGPLGALADRIVLSFPVHVALRQRLKIVQDALVETVARAASLGADPVRALSAPCGLLRDVLGAAARIGDPVRWTGVDLDAMGDVLPEAARRAGEAGLRVELLREDLFGPCTGLESRARSEGPFHVASCIGLSAWVDLADVASLARRFHGLLGRGGTLLLDGWRPGGDAELARLLGLPARYHDPGELEEVLEGAGFWVDDARPTGNGACTVWIARRR